MPVAALLAMGLAAPAMAGQFNPLGDGSDYNNADLLRDPTTGCENCAPNPPHEWDDPWFDLDWSLALRGSYVHTTSTDYFEAIASPSVSLSHEMLRGGYSFSASAEVTRSTLEDVRLQAGRVGFEGNYRLDAATAANGAFAFAVTQDSA
ncbi:MAG TPA: hypothetical protein GYA10_00425, partial [Alphaproteobacteria bacterium]|nr:hypothetical protein [Alphaproteobacteria bacterium]